MAIRRLPLVKLKTLPRMADYCEWVVAAEPALPWKAGAFIRAYEANRESANAVALEQSPVGAVLLAFMGDRECWEGTPAGLLNELSDDRLAADDFRKQRGWPKAAHHLSGCLKRISPDLRRVGLSIEMWREKRARRIRLEKVGNPASPASPASPTSAAAPRTLFSGDAPESGQRHPASPSVTENGPGAIKNADARTGDAGDAKSRNFSGDSLAGTLDAVFSDLDAGG
jgi:hypothetical protein